MSASYPALRSLQRSSARIAQNAEHHIRRAFVQERATLRHRELRAESDADIREAIRSHMGGAS